MQKFSCIQAYVVFSQLPECKPNKWLNRRLSQNTIIKHLKTWTKFVRATLVWALKPCWVKSLRSCVSNAPGYLVGLWTQHTGLSFLSTCRSMAQCGSSHYRKCCFLLQILDNKNLCCSCSSVCHYELAFRWCKKWVTWAFMKAGSNWICWSYSMSQWVSRCMNIWPQEVSFLPAPPPLPRLSFWSFCSGLDCSLAEWWQCETYNRKQEL